MLAARRALVLGMIAGQGCGGESRDPGGKQPVVYPSQDPAHADPDASPVCEPGERRVAAPTEEGNECVCIERGFWDCYGVPPSRQVGGRASCKSQLTVGGEQCDLTISDCSDTRTYSLRCLSDYCLCIVNAEPVGELEAGTPCITSIDDANRLCSWSLDMTTQ